MENNITQEKAEKWANQEKVSIGTYVRMRDKFGKWSEDIRLPDYDITTDLNQEEDSDHPTDLF